MGWKFESFIIYKVSIYFEGIQSVWKNFKNSILIFFEIRMNFSQQLLSKVVRTAIVSDSNQNPGSIIISKIIKISPSSYNRNNFQKIIKLFLGKIIQSKNFSHLKVINSFLEKRKVFDAFCNFSQKYLHFNFNTEVEAKSNLSIKVDHKFWKQKEWEKSRKVFWKVIKMHFHNCNMQ
jgi:hypothetical protein